MDYLVVGLGNPGIEFVGSRHNMGADVAAVLADRYQGRLRPEKGLHALACEIRIGGHRVMVAVPQTFMNESGRAVAPLVRRAGIDQLDHGDLPSGGPTGPPGPSAEPGVQPADDNHAARSPSQTSYAGISGRLIVVHDELDLPSGRVKVKAGGGSAGNNGLKSIDSHLHDNGYLRVARRHRQAAGAPAGGGLCAQTPGCRRKGCAGSSHRGSGRCRRAHRYRWPRSGHEPSERGRLSGGGVVVHCNGVAVPVTGLTGPYGTLAVCGSTGCR